MTNKNKNRIPLPILILICSVLLFAMHISLSTLTLAIWGDSVMGTVDSYQARLDDTGAGQNRSRTISKGYWFMANGKEYRGHVMYGSDEAWPSLGEGETRSERIRYLEVFPYVNKPAALCEFDEMGEVAIIYHILAPIGCLLLLLLVTSTFKRKKAGRKRPDKVKGPQTHDTSGDALLLCFNCGSGLPEGVNFCISCGASTHAPAQTADYMPQRDSKTAGLGLIGFSERYNSPEILEAARQNKKSSIGCMWILVLVPLLGFPLAGLLMDDFPFEEALVIGVGIALVMLIVSLFALRRSRKPIWEGVVVNKFSKERSEHRGGEDDNYRSYMEYNTVIATDAGTKKTIVEKDSGRHMYDYLAVGDRVRYHPKFGTYEKFDKSKDHIIYCNVCSMLNPIHNDRCKRCNHPLFK